MNKLLKSHAVGLPEETKREDNLTKHSGCVYAYVKKKKKNYWWEKRRQAEKARHIIDNETQDPFQFVSVWLWFWRCFVNPYVFK